MHADTNLVVPHSTSYLANPTRHFGDAGTVAMLSGSDVGCGSRLAWDSRVATGSTVPRGSTELWCSLLIWGTEVV